jgi:UDP-GlcNAc:undecaprenyl-phosphate GlcNAc-1-phosphate transferase
MTQLLVVGVGICATAIAALLVRALAFRLGIVSYPNRIVPQHPGPVAYLGGVAVFFGTASALLSTSETPDNLPGGVIAGAVGFLLLGLWDDIRPMQWWQKLLSQTAVATCAVAMGVNGATVSAKPFSAVALVSWIVIIVNCVNLTDVCDGLASGVCTITFLALALAAPSWHVAPLALAAACVGLLIFNAPPASIFLGDAGAHLLGFLLAVFIADDVSALPVPLAVYRAILLLNVFAFEIVFIITMRVRGHRPIWQASRDHFAYRMQAVGISRWTTVLMAWTAAGVCALFALLLPSMGKPGLLLTTLCFSAASGMAFRVLSRFEVPPPATAGPAQ